MFARFDNRAQSRLFFPALWTPGEQQWSIPSETYTKFYDTILLPTMREVCAVPAAHWPASYAAARLLYQDTMGKFHFRMMDITEWDIPALETKLLERMEVDPSFVGAFWEHEIRGVKDATGHEMDDPEARSDRFRSLTDVFDMDRVTPSEWVIDVAVEISTVGHNLAWLTLGHARILEYALPGVTMDQIEGILHSTTKYTLDPVAHMAAIAGFRAHPGRNRGTDRVSYVNVYTTDKCNTYQQWPGSFKRQATSAVLPKNMPTLLSHVSRIGDVFAACAGSEAGSQDGHARFEIRVPLANAETVMTRSMDDLIPHVVVAIPNDTWW